MLARYSQESATVLYYLPSHQFATAVEQYVEKTYGYLSIKQLITEFDFHLKWNILNSDFAGNHILVYLLYELSNITIVNCLLLFLQNLIFDIDIHFHL